LGFVVAALAGCLQPVGEADGSVIISCQGSCPYGECDDWCASHADAGPCASPADCLRLSACHTQSSCSAYTPDRFRLGDGWATACAPTPGSYCTVGPGADGTNVQTAVGCTDAGLTRTVCTGINVCDGGVLPAICRTACGQRYCIR
jgi:hypothetical protein